MTRTSFAMFLGTVLLATAAAAAENVPSNATHVRRAQPAAATMTTVADIVDRMQQSEATLIANMRAFRPMVEIYIQNFDADATLALVPTTDAYALGRFDWRSGPRLQGLNGSTDTVRFTGTAKNKALEYVPDGFVAMAVPDWQLLDARRYDFTLVRREFLGEARCFVVDAKPRGHENAGFTGRLWIEDRGYNIVRFNGINLGFNRTSLHKKTTFHVDSWRTNVLPGLWVPSSLYIDEMAPAAATSDRTPRFKSQIKLWGYDPKRGESSDDFTAITIDEPAVRDDTARELQMSPTESLRRWAQEAETNVLDRLDRTALLAAPGNVERVLETVINNLAVTSDLVLDRPVNARVMLTSPLQSFTVGHTIVLSRGLIDVLPDEASLAMVLAHELSHIVLGHAVIDTRFAISNRLAMNDEDLLALLTTPRSAKDETAADAKVQEMLRKSPYQGKLGSAGLFLRFITASTNRFASLLQPHRADGATGGGPLPRLTELVRQSPDLAPERLDQIPALALGARLVLDPWSRRLELLRTANSPVISVSEKTPMGVTPFAPYLKYAQMPAAPVADVDVAIESFVPVDSIAAAN